MVSYSDKDDSDNSSPTKPSTPISEGDWQVVPATGGTITKDSISITFPSGTFSNDTKVAITAVKKGETGGDCEVSPFYQLTMPLKLNRPITVNIKCSKQTEDVHFLTIEPCYKKSLSEMNRHNISYTASYGKGGFSFTFPSTNNEENSGDLYLTLGLAKSPKVTSGRTPASEIQGKEGNIEWYYDVSWGNYIYTSSADEKLMLELEIKLNSYIPEAIKKIHALGFFVVTDRQIPFIFTSTVDKKQPDAFGYFDQSLICDENSSIQLVLPTLRKASETEIRQTVIHELLHYYQSELDPRSCVKKAGSDESTVLSEAGSVWAEQFMDNGNMNSNFLSQFLTIYLICTTDVDTAFSFETDSKVLNSAFEKYSRFGYAMSTMLYYLTSPIGDMSAFNIDKTKIVELYNYWNKNAGQTFTPLNNWLSDHKSGFLSTGQFDKYILALLSETLIKGINIQNVGYPEGVSRSETFKDFGKKDFTSTCYINGCVSHKFKLFDYSQKDPDKSLKGTEVVFKQTNGKDVKTYIIAQSRGESKFKLLKGVVNNNDSLVIPGEDLDALFGKGELAYLHAVTINHISKKCDFGVSCELREAQQKFDVGTSAKTITFTYKCYTNNGSSNVSEEFKDKEITVSKSDGKVHITATKKDTGTL